MSAMGEVGIRGAGRWGEGGGRKMGGGGGGERGGEGRKAGI